MNLDEIVYYLFIISMSSFYESCNTYENPFYRICVPYKVENLKLIVFNMIKEINELKAFSKYFSCECRCEEDYVCNHSECPCKCDRNSDICAYLKDCRCIKILVANLEVKCHEIDDIPDSPSINPSNGINYWVIGVILLAIACFLLLLTIVVKHHMQCGFTIPCSLSY